MILVCHRGALGDFILAWPAISSLRKKFPAHEFAGIGRPEYMELAKSLGLIDFCFNAESAALMPFFSGTAPPPLPSAVSGAVLWLADGAKAAATLGKNASLPVVTIVPFPKDIRKHLAEYNYESVREPFGLEKTDDLAALMPPPQALRTDQKLLLVHPGSGSERKNLPVSFYLTATEELGKRFGLEPSFVLGPAELERGLPEKLRGRHIFSPKTVSELKELLLKAALYIGNDSGPSHLAAAIGIRTIAIYISTDPAIWGTVGKYSTNIRASDQQEALDMLFES